MLAVIFRAELASLDAGYAHTASRMRDLAVNEYGCREFISCTEGGFEIAISYWDSEDQIKAWRENVEHRSAQMAGRNKWYTSYTVDVTRLVRGYRYPPE